MISRTFFKKHVVPALLGGGLSEREVEEKAAFFDSLVDSIPISILAIDNQRRIIVVNRKIEEFFEVRAAELLDKIIEEALPRLKLSGTPIDKIDNAPVKYAMGDKTILANRSPLMIGGLEGVVSVFQDVTWFEATSRELAEVRADQQFLENMIDSSYDGIYITDKEGKTLAVNQSYERISGISREFLVGKYMDELVREGILSVCLTDDVVKAKKPITLTQTIRNGKKVVITGSPILDEDGNVSSVITNVRDITELLHLEKQLQLSNERASLYQKEIFKGEGDIICGSEAFKNVLSLATKVSRMASTTLILGETGVGKEVVARYIHKNSLRENAPYIKINCGAIPASLLESELFGYVPGAFTGASSKGKMGMFELADGGTLFLDEIGEMPIELQASLLRVLQDGEITRVGDSNSIRVDVRIIAATNRNLPEMIEQGKFRKDLFYRLNVVAISIPPLAEREDDIPGLAEKAIEKLNEKYGFNKTITTGFIKLLIERQWPGNVRELFNFIERQFVLSEEDFLDRFVEKAQVEGTAAKEEDIFVEGILPMTEATKKLEAILIKRAMKQGKSTYKAAALLGMSQPTFYRKYKELFPGGEGINNG